MLKLIFVARCSFNFVSNYDTTMYPFLNKSAWQFAEKAQSIPLDLKYANIGIRGFTVKTKISSNKMIPNPTLSSLD